jgi:hypothetical protein
MKFRKMKAGPRMNRSLRVSALILVMAAFPWGCDSYNLSFKDYYGVPILPPSSPPPPVSYWARTVEAGPGTSWFNAVAADGGGIYAAGYQYSTGTPFEYGTLPDTHATGAYSSDDNVILVKYGPSGDALWAKTTAQALNRSQFNAVAADGAAVYAAGRQNEATAYNYGTLLDPVSATGPSSFNVVLVKYNALTGAAQWARTVESGPGDSLFNAVAAAGAAVYAAGRQSGTGTFDYGGVASVPGTGGNKAVLVKYDAEGSGLWAKTVSPAIGTCEFNAVAVDGAGNVYAAGYQYSSTVIYNYGNGQTAQATGGSDYYNAVLVKYNALGVAQWAKTVKYGGNQSQFYGVAVDAVGNVYAAGYQMDSGPFDYGGAVNGSGTSGSNAVLVKYNADGVAQWVRTITDGSACEFRSLAVDGAGYVYAAGDQSDTVVFNYGTLLDPVIAAGSFAGSNVVLVKYRDDGTALWAKTTEAGLAGSRFNGVAAYGPAVYAAGYQYGTGPYDYGDGKTAAATFGSSFNENVVLVKYPR